MFHRSNRSNGSSRSNPHLWLLPRDAGETFYEACQVPLNFFQAAWRIFCRVMLAK
jgi:hypothetical protein